MFLFAIIFVHAAFLNDIFSVNELQKEEQKAQQDLEESSSSPLPREVLAVLARMAASLDHMSALPRIEGLLRGE